MVDEAPTSIPTSTNTITPYPSSTPSPSVTPSPTFTPSPTPLAGSGYVDFLSYILFTEGEWNDKLVRGSFRLDQTQIYNNKNAVTQVIDDEELAFQQAEIIGLNLSKNAYSKLMGVKNRNIKYMIGSRNNPNFVLVTYIFDYEDQESNPENIPFEVFWVNADEIKSLYNIGCKDMALISQDIEYTVSTNGNFAIVRVPNCIDTEMLDYKELIINLSTGKVNSLEFLDRSPSVFFVSPEEKKILYDSGSQLYIANVNGIIDPSFNPIKGNNPTWITEESFAYILDDSIYVFNINKNENVLLYKPKFNRTITTDINFLSEKEILVFSQEGYVVGSDLAPCEIFKLNIQTGEKIQWYSISSKWTLNSENEVIWSPDRLWFITDIETQREFKSFGNTFYPIFHDFIICDVEKGICQSIMITTPYCVNTNQDRSLCINVGEMRSNIIAINFK